MFAFLGETKFELTLAPTSFSDRRKYEFSEHPVLTGRPQLQKIGEALREESLTFRFHKGFCDPTAEIENLRILAQQQDPLPFILGDGTFAGDFVIESIDSTVEKLDGSGAPIWIDVTVSLKDVPPERVVQYEQRRIKVAPAQKGDRVRGVKKQKGNKKKLKWPV